VFLQNLIPHLTPFHISAHYRIHGVWHLDLRARRRSAVCPCCRHRSTAVHSSYRRTVADMPIARTPVFIHLQVRRFFCRYTACLQRIFAEQFPTLVPVRGRHSWGICAALRHVGLAVGGRAGIGPAGELSDDCASHPSRTPALFRGPTGDRARRVGLAARPVLWDHRV
jgi:transposase IS204/IS1001/IS1096/IS1165 family protein